MLTTATRTSLWCFNPRAPCGARPAYASGLCVVYGFQSTRPMRGATWYTSRNSPFRQVSIHAPHAGRDSGHVCTLPHRNRFNPRAPCGARPAIAPAISVASMFQSTRPMRGATGPRNRPCVSIGVSIHAPHAGRDRCPVLQSPHPSRFNPRAPCGARLRQSVRRGIQCLFQSTRPMRGATIAPTTARERPEFQSTRPMRGAT